MKGSQVLVHSIGPNGVLAKVIGENGSRAQVQYYDARDGGDVVRWVNKSEVAIMSVVSLSK